MHRKPKNADGAQSAVDDDAQPAVADVAQSEVLELKRSYNKMQNALDSQYAAARSFTHLNRGKGL